LQLNYELAAAVKNLHRVVQPGGTVLASFPGIRRMTEAAQEEECYWGVTNMSVHLLFAEPFRAENVAVKSFGNVLSATAYLHGLAADELTKQEMDHEDQEYQVVIGVRAKKT
jgi:hypothetical protein